MQCIQYISSISYTYAYILIHRHTQYTHSAMHSSLGTSHYSAIDRKTLPPAPPHLCRCISAPSLPLPISTGVSPRHREGGREGGRGEREREREREREFVCCPVCCLLSCSLTKFLTCMVMFEKA